ncbi:MAG: hypothetical protein IK002_01935 [Treponema sp.]|uniref:hypothetical protein n=1 Tax=Treponema sp. TaxID=166 RepID=UPI00298DA325|nr:hypothetical protein [Treponema sp.]MBR5932724.1 hypothetical protein [Treponema sp.]
MNDLYVNNLKIDWSVISEDSYLRKIHSIAKIQKLTFEKPVTIFLEKMVQENLHY